MPPLSDYEVASLGEALEAIRGMVAARAKYGQNERSQSAVSPSSPHQ